MRRSIRRTLLGWYAVILVLVIGGLGTTLFLHRKAAALDRVDAELRTHALAITNAIEWDVPDGFELELRDEYRAWFRQTGDDAPYFVVWGPGRQVLVRTEAAPRDVRHPSVGAYRGDVSREVVARGAGETTVLVGRGITGIRSSVAAFGGFVLLAGLGALALALVGGWLLVSRVLRPIDRISASAARLSATNPSARIDIEDTESELGRLAGTLNDAFGRLEAALERQKTFTADASHELRTPLAVVQASAEWALRKERTSAEHEQALDSCRRAARKMSALVDDLLALARDEAGADAAGTTATDLAQIAEEASSLLQPLAREHGVRMSVLAEPAPVAGDGHRLHAVASALLSNAIRHNRRGGRVEVRTGLDDDAVFLEVRDDGPGIPEADLPHVFERFYRVDRARSKHTGGSGLGLAIAQQVARAHGGVIEARSEPGQGCVFTIRLPLRCACN